MFKTTAEIKQWLHEHDIEEYFIHSNLIVDVLTDVDLSSENLEELPIQFGFINGNFSLFGNELSTLKGCPRRVMGYFDCSHNNLKDLKFCPNEIEGTFFLSNNHIKGLEYAPDMVKGKFKCYGNPIEDLNGFKTELGDSFEHGVDHLRDAIEGFEHLYIKIKSYDLQDYSLILSPQQIAKIRMQEELVSELENKQKKQKKIKI